MSGAADLAAFDPIFIVGAPRSGTTLLRAMLSRHPRVGLSDETYYLYTVYQRCRAFGDLANPANRKALIESYTATQRVQQLEIDLSRLRDRLMAEGTSYPAFCATLLQCYAEAQGKTRAGEKTPAHARYVNTLLEWYPNARVIHLVRDARDVCASLSNMPWSRKAANGQCQAVGRSHLGRGTWTMKSSVLPGALRRPCRRARANPAEPVRTRRGTIRPGNAGYQSGIDRRQTMVPAVA